MGNNKDKKSFWGTLPGILTGVAGLIGAIVVLFTALIQFGIINIPSAPDPTTEPSTEPAEAEVTEPAVRSDTPPPASPSIPDGTIVLKWMIIEGRPIIDQDGKDWEKYEADIGFPGLYLRTDDINSFGDFLELNSDESFDLEENGELKTGTWTVEGNTVILVFSPGG